MLNSFFKWLMGRTPGLPRRHIPDNDPQNKKDTDEPPRRDEIWVTCQLRRFDPLAQVRKGWGDKLKLLFSLYISGKYEGKPRKKDQALQVCLHEMMHIALWDIKEITHSTDEHSILYAYIDGSNLEPTDWDLKVMREAAERIDTITLDADKINTAAIMPILSQAVILWNSWIGRELFLLLSSF